MSGAWAYFLREAIRQAWRQRLLTLVAVSALGLAALFAGSWGLLYRNAKHWQASVGQAAEVAAYLRPNLSPAAQGSALDAARDISGVASVELVTPEQAAAAMSADPQVKEALALLGENPLPPTLKVHLLSDQPSALALVAGRLRGLENVEEVDSGEGAVEGLLKVSGALRTSLLGLGALFSLTALLIVAAVLRLASWSRRQELGIMRLVGASHGFIRAPFLVEGLFQGLLAGALAAGALAGAMAWLDVRLRADLQVDLAAFMPAPVDWSLAAGLMLGTGLLGLAGAAVALATVTLAYEDEEQA